jgi:hypothetical protein
LVQCTNRAGQAVDGLLWAEQSYAPIVLTNVLFSMCRSRPASISRQLFRLELMPFRVLQFLHSGIVGDCVVWMILGVATLVLAIG